MAHPIQRRWYPLVFAVAALVLLPLSVLLLSWQSIDTQIWSHLWDTQMPRLLGNTLTLVAGVGVGVTLLGVSLAWLTSLCEFPGRRWLDWALMLPFAIPAYVLAFVFVGLLDFSGPVQTLLREVFGSSLRLPRVRSTGGVILVLVLVFYPYVYLLARSAFLAQGKGLMEAARVLGQSPWQAFWRVALPMARPAIGAGVALALMETLADFGAVSVFNFDTFTTAIYKTWYGFFSLSSAAQLASLLLLAVMLVLYGERRARGASRAGNERPRGSALYRLQGFKAWAASGWCLLVFACAFVVPLLQLLAWFWRRGRFDLDERYTGLILHTLYLGGMAALVTVAVAMLLAFARRQAPTRVIRSGVSLANLGYALPGSVLAVSIMLAFSYLDREWVIPLSSWLSFGAVAGLPGAFYRGRLWAAGKQPGTDSSVVAGGGPQPGRRWATTVFQSVSAVAGARHLECGAAGVRRCAQGNARDPADAPVWLGYAGGAGLRDDQRRRVGAGLVAGLDPGADRPVAGDRPDPAFGQTNRLGASLVPCGYNARHSVRSV